MAREFARSLPRPRECARSFIARRDFMRQAEKQKFQGPKRVPGCLKNGYVGGGVKSTQKKKGKRKVSAAKEPPRSRLRCVALSFRRKWPPGQTLAKPNKKDHEKRWGTPTDALRTSQTRRKSGRRTLLFSYSAPLRSDRALKGGLAPLFFRRQLL